MKLLKIGTATCALCLVAFLLIAGCASQVGGSNQPQTTASTENPQVTVTPATAGPGSSGTNNGAFIDDSGNVPSQNQSQVTLAPDTPVDTSTGAAALNMTPDTTDFGDITP